MAQSIYDRMTPAPPAPFYFPVSAYYCVSQCVRVSLRQKQREKVCVWVMRRWGKLLSSHLLSLYSYSLWVAVCLCVCVWYMCLRAVRLSLTLWRIICLLPWGHRQVLSKQISPPHTLCPRLWLKVPTSFSLNFQLCMHLHVRLRGDLWHLQNCIEIFSTATPPEIVGLFSEEPTCSFKSNSWISVK